MLFFYFPESKYKVKFKKKFCHLRECTELLSIAAEICSDTETQT